MHEHDLAGSQCPEDSLENVRGSGSCTRSLPAERVNRPANGDVSQRIHLGDQVWILLSVREAEERRLLDRLAEGVEVKATERLVPLALGR